MAEPSEAISSEALLGQRIRAQRNHLGWTLEQASQSTSLARSTLSKIENGLMSPTYDALIKLAAGLKIDISELFEPTEKVSGVGRRSITHKGTGQSHHTPFYDHTLLCNAMSNKDMIPFKTKILARSFDDFDDWSRHTGEEFVYVLSGEVELFTEFYEPVRLGEGDAWYIDSRMGHRVISVSAENAEVLWVSTTHPRETKKI
ncbi:MAG: XRE family transcriptional regulator [Rhodoferax sp.]|uniref:helix-turn-helix domain-containing protein n=1 Tax=Rhodoferax sp. TaxID=50421 RepID=UPI00260E77CC|nr:XRE family transcriptional regulator [Rhodoferax sp.]MDD5332601.1 XRE family transcriptional regulator [Rhodoferax sp.]